MNSMSSVVAAVGLFSLSGCAGTVPVFDVFVEVHAECDGKTPCEEVRVPLKYPSSRDQRWGGPGGFRRDSDACARLGWDGVVQGYAERVNRHTADYTTQLELGGAEIFDRSGGFQVPAYEPEVGRTTLYALRSTGELEGVVTSADVRIEGRTVFARYPSGRAGRSVVEVHTVGTAGNSLSQRCIPKENDVNWSGWGPR